MGDQVTPDTLTAEQQAVCQAQVDRLVAKYGRRDIIAKIRQHDGFTDSTTGERYPPEWVIETRIGRKVIVTSSSEPMRAPLDEDWLESLRDEIDHQLRSKPGARR